jgi:MoaA/NifB/PqqE/SkfB family radical SAM enzyme
MSFARVLQRTWRDNHLFAVLVELTYRCNLDCFFCYNDLALRGRPLSLAQYFAFFAELRQLEVMNLTLTGGEPLAHPDFLRLGARARELGFVVRIKSNGHVLRGTMARRIREEIDPFLIEVSLHGASAAVHDRQTRVAGSFARLLPNLREMRRLGLRVKLNSTLTAWNEHEAEAMMDLADELGMPLQIDPEVTQRDDGSREPLAISASRAGLARLFALLEERAARARRPGGSTADENAGAAAGVGAGMAAGAGAVSAAPPPASAPAVRAGRQADDGLMPAAVEKHCGAGSSGIAVDPYGNVYPCVQWRRPVGNLHQQSIGEIWAHSTGLAEVRALTVAAKRVVDGYGMSGPLLAFCPGNAAAHSGGDPLAIYPEALNRVKVFEEVRQMRDERRDHHEAEDSGSGPRTEPRSAGRELLPVLR